MSIPRIETSRLTLRGFRPADRDPFVTMNADPEVMAFMSRRLDPAASEAFLGRIRARWAADGFGIWAIERQGDGTFLGFAGLSEPGFPAAFAPAIEVGWRLARPAWGHGYATEAGAAALRFGFEVVGLEEIVSFTAVANERSRRVMERLGMTHDPADDFDYPLVPIGHPVSRQVLYRFTRDHWERAVTAGGTARAKSRPTATSDLPPPIAGAPDPGP
jgi:RimJ/RimL family protein N-acetyltransferase